MAENWRTLADLSRKIEGDRHEAAKIFMTVAERQARRKTIDAADLNLIRKHYGREALQKLDMAEYARLRRSGEYEKLEEKFALTPAEIDRAEAALRRAGTVELGEWTETGIMSASEARPLLEKLVELDASADDEKAISKALKAAEKDKLNGPFDEDVFRRSLAAAGIQVDCLTEEAVEKYGHDLPNLARISCGLEPRPSRDGDEPVAPDAQFVARLARLVQHNTEQATKPTAAPADEPEAPVTGEGVMSADEAAALTAAEQSSAADSAS